MAKYGDDISGYIEDKVAGLRKAGKVIENQVVHAMAKAVDSATDSSVTVKQSGSNMRAEIEGEKGTSPGDVIDLKKFFEQSDKKKDTADGGWYLIIPMRRYTGANRREDSSGMSNRLYKDLRSQKRGEGYAQLTSDFLLDNRRPGSMISELNYKPKSKGITRIPQEHWGHQYVSFRTVSDKSHPASWVINRNKAGKENKTKEVQRIMSEVKDFHAKQLLK